MVEQENNLIISNVEIFLSIVDDSHELMTEALELGRTPRKGGGYIIKLDSEQRSIKEAFKVILFAGAAIEALWHQKAVELKSKTFADSIDRGKVANKLREIGIADEELLDQIKLYYDCRRQIVHEKAREASYRKQIFIAEKEANNAVSILKRLQLELSELKRE